MGGGEVVVVIMRWVGEIELIGETIFDLAHCWVPSHPIVQMQTDGRCGVHTPQFSSLSGCHHIVGPLAIKDSEFGGGGGRSKRGDETVTAELLKGFQNLGESG